MHAFAGIILTTKNTNVDKRMEKLCDYYGEGKPNAFCDGWAPVYIDSDGNLHTVRNFGDDMQLYCEALGNYRVRNVVNPHYGANVFPSDSIKFYPAGLSALVTPSGKVYFDDDVEPKLKEYCEKHPNWGIHIINYHC